MAKKKVPKPGGDRGPGRAPKPSSVSKKKVPVPSVKRPARMATRVSVIHLQGPPEERDWLTLLQKKTHFPKSTIVRMALANWAKLKKLPPCPTDES